MIAEVAAVGGVATAGAFATHALQGAKAKRAATEKEAAIAAAVAREAAERETERARDAAKDAEEREKARKDAQDAYLRQHPALLVERARAKLDRDVSATANKARHARTEQAVLESEIADATPATPFAVQAVCIAAIGVLPLTFGLSASQLVPSFNALSAAPSPVNTVLGVLLAAIEVAVALLLAGALRPENGWAPLGSKLTVAVAATFAAVVIAAQVAWAPAHDTIPLQRQIATANQTLALDRTSGTDPAVVVAGEQEVLLLEKKLEQVTHRDQGLALIATLGADVSAWPALSGIMYIQAARRRRKIRPRLAQAASVIAGHETEAAALPNRALIALQDEVVRLELDPDAVGDAWRERGEPAPPADAENTPRDSTGGARPAPPATERDDGPDADRVTPDDLFGPNRADDDRRWSDPI
jgi:hypothetical protein